jgi:hypothetical protein
VPTTGWHALKAAAPDNLRIHWLDKLTLAHAGADGSIVLTTENPAIAAKVRDLLSEVAGLEGLARRVGIDPAKVTIRAPRHGADPVPPDLKTVPLSSRGMEEMGRRIEEASDRPAEPLPAAFDGNTTSLAAYRMRTEDPCREYDDDPGQAAEGILVGDAEVARPRRDDERPKCPDAGGSGRPGVHGTGLPPSPDRDGG